MKSLLRQRADYPPLPRMITSPSDAFLFLRIACFAALVPLLLRMKLSTVEQVLTPRSERMSSASGNPSRLVTIEAMTEAAMRRPLIRRSCLVRGTTLYYFLTREGLDLQLSFGVGMTDGALAGHCWLVKDGEPYLETQDPRPTFSVIYSIPRDVSPTSGMTTYRSAQ